MVRESGRECCRGTYRWSHGGGWIVNISLDIDIRVEVLCSMGYNCFNPLMCSGDLRGMIVIMLNSLSFSNSERISCRFSCWAGVDDTYCVLTMVLMDGRSVGTEAGFMVGNRC